MMSTSTGRVRVFEVYWTPDGLSARSDSVHEVAVQVAARSVRQAYRLAGAGRPFDGTAGILEWVGRRDLSVSRLWDGCDETLGLRHGDGARRICRAACAHLAEDEEWDDLVDEVDTDEVLRHWADEEEVAAR